MKVLDLFSGTGGWSQAFLDHGHEVLRIDNDPQFTDVPNTVIEDITACLYLPDYYDVILASPPCQKFSVARISTNWSGDKNTPLTPKTQGAKQAMQLVDTTLTTIQSLRPKYWWMENPTGAMRRLSIMQGWPRHQVTFCKYGKHYRKPTDLWGVWPDTWNPPLPCTGHPRNGTAMLLSRGGMRFVLDADGRPCREAASRGSKTGIQGLKNAVERGAIPYMLSLEVMRACQEAGL